MKNGFSVNWKNKFIGMACIMFPCALLGAAILMMFLPRDISSAGVVFGYLQVFSAFIIFLGGYMLADLQQESDRRLQKQKAYNLGKVLVSNTLAAESFFQRQRDYCINIANSGRTSMVASTAHEIAITFLNLKTIFSDYISVNGSQEAFEAMNLFLDYERWASRIGMQKTGSLRAGIVYTVDMIAKLDIMRTNFEQIGQLLFKEHGFTSTAHNIYPIVEF